MVRAGVKISSVLEDYLETIAFLKANKGVVGVSDIAEVLG
jgi:Mn-dependent DtxR family transcriptional regulator